MKTSLALLALAALGACAHQPITWYRVDTTQQRFALDKTKCAFEAEKATASYGPGPRAYSLGDAIGQGIVQGMDLAARQNRIMILCMQAMGYSSAPPPSPYVEAPAAAPTTSEPVAIYNPPAESAALPVQTSTTKSPASATAEPPATIARGQYEYVVEKIAKSESCPPQKIVSLTAKGPGFEAYTVSCPDGESLAVRCDFGNCRALR